MPSLFDPIKLGAIHAPNRILMAPLTRGRATRDHVPTDLMKTYYAQRASAGLILTEATGISRQGLGWPYAPGLWTEAQVEGWKPVVAAVHEAGGRIFAQLWHMGRVVHSSFLGGEPPVSASATRRRPRRTPMTAASPMTRRARCAVDEIPGVIGDYVRAARNAIAAGFDGVQIHGANGYLIDQFLRDGTNLRDDDYGGPVENRIRLLARGRRRPWRTRSAPGGPRSACRPTARSRARTTAIRPASFPPPRPRSREIGIAFLELREPGFDGTLRQGRGGAGPPLYPHARSTGRWC